MSRTLAALILLPTIATCSVGTKPRAAGQEALGSGVAEIAGSLVTRFTGDSAPRWAYAKFLVPLLLVYCFRKRSKAAAAARKKASAKLVIPGDAEQIEVAAAPALPEDAPALPEDAAKSLCIDSPEKRSVTASTAAGDDPEVEVGSPEPENESAPEEFARELVEVAAVPAVVASSPELEAESAQEDAELEAESAQEDAARELAEAAATPEDDLTSLGSEEVQLAYAEYEAVAALVKDDLASLGSEEVQLAYAEDEAVAAPVKAPSAEATPRTAGVARMVTAPRLAFTRTVTAPSAAQAVGLQLPLMQRQTTPLMQRQMTSPLMQRQISSPAQAAPGTPRTSFRTLPAQAAPGTPRTSFRTLPAQVAPGTPRTSLRSPAQAAPGTPRTSFRTPGPSTQSLSRSLTPTNTASPMIGSQPTWRTSRGYELGLFLSTPKASAPSGSIVIPSSAPRASFGSIPAPAAGPSANQGAVWKSSSIRQ